MLAMIENVWLVDVARELGVEAVVVEREDRRGDRHGVQHHRQPGVLRGVVDRVVAAVAPERVEARRTAGRRPPPTARRRSARSRARRPRVLRAGDDRAEQRGMARRPAVDEPRVVGARERGGVVGLGEHRQLEQVVGEQHGEVDVDLLQLGDHLLRRVDHPRRLVRAREARRERAVAARGEPGDVEVALGHVGHVAQRDVPGRVAVRRELARALVDVDVGVDDQEVAQRCHSSMPCRRAWSRTAAASS